MGKIYLCNGKDGYGNALNVLRNSNTRGFSDISILDLTTIEIPKKDVKDYFKELNPNIDLSGDYYICTANQSSIYLPIFKPENSNALNYINKLKELAKSRYKNIQTTGKAGTLNRYDSEKILREVLTDIYKLDNISYHKITNYYTNICNDIQESIALRDFGENRNKADIQYINRLILHDQRNKITSYTIVRNLVLAYARLMDNEDTMINRQEIENGYTDLAGTNEKAKQLSLFDFM